MSVYNKELIIDGEAVLSPEQQVYKNAKDIKILKQYVKESYHTSTALTSSSVSVATEDVEGLGEASSGWLLTDDGLLFKITANDGTTTLIQFFSDISGPQGPAGQDGASLEIDDSSTSASKVWSSQKTSNEIDLIRDKGVYYTTVQPTLDGGVYSLNVSDLGNNNSYTWQKYGDLIIYIDGNGNPTELWKCVGLNGAHTVMTVEKIADYSKGKNLYLHNVKYSYGAWYVCIAFVSSSNVEIDTKEKLSTWLSNNGFTSVTRFYPCGGYHAGDTNKDIIGINAESPTATPYVTYRDNSYSVLSGTPVDTVTII